ncbi:RNA recognition motif domain-containing protein [Calditrichota bacterium]
MRIYAGGLSQEISEEDLKQAFAEFGQVESVKIILDNYSGRSKGFGFIEMLDADEAKAAIEGLDGKELKETTIKVSEARPREERRGYRGGQGGNRGGYGGGKGGGYRGDKKGYGGGRSGRGGNR